MKKKLEKKIKKVLILEISYKANVADLRNSLALKIYSELKKKYKKRIYAYDPIIETKNFKNLKILNNIKGIDSFDLIVPLINHKVFKKKFSKDFKKNSFKYFDLFGYLT